MTDAALPIDDVLPDLISALKTHHHAVLQAPPGAGKTTRVPLALLETGVVTGRILILEPRRLATRAAAERMARTLGEEVGKTVGYRIRGESRAGKNTRIEVVTEGILTRMIQNDASLPGVGAVIFDEFHERSIQADLGLALTLEAREALRDDLMVLVMSATLDAQPVAELMGNAPIITSQGQSFPVETIWLDRPWSHPGKRNPRFEEALADLTLRAISETSGGVLVFAPGASEINRTEACLKSRLPPDVKLFSLFGAMDFKAQRAAIAPLTSGRKVVLATSIAETSLTIPDIRVVVDGGRARRSRFDPASAMGRLVTERVTKAEATQRRGRAGRVSEGWCYRLWTKGEEGGFAPFPPAEIESADVTPLVLEIALWGARDFTQMPFLTQPGASAVRNSQQLLRTLDALDENNAITNHGRELAKLPLHPRLAHMLVKGGKFAPLLAALLAERDPLGGKPRPTADLTLRLEAVRDQKKFTQQRPFSVNRQTIARIKEDSRRLKTGGGRDLSIPELAALAYPDRIGLRRKGESARYVMSGGKGAFLEDSDPLANQRLIVVTDLDGDQREARIRQAVPISETALRELFPSQIETRFTCDWSRREKAVRARKQQVFGALVLSDQIWTECSKERLSGALIEGLRDLGVAALEISKATRLWIARVEWLRARDADLPDCSDKGLLLGADEFLGPLLFGKYKTEDLKQIDLLNALKNRLSWEQSQTLEQLAPSEIKAPTGTRLPIDYSADQPKISVRLQEVFGLGVHPTVGPDRVPLLIELLSPARRPVQTTADLPGFWSTSYNDVRRDMRGRYPKHPWPEDPTQAAATCRVNPRK